MSKYQTQLVNFLSDMYSVEQQALAQLVAAPDLALNQQFANHLQMHCGETEIHARLVLERLEAYGQSAPVIKDILMKAGGKGFLLFAKLMPETPGRLAAHAYSYEAMEWAGYELLTRFARKAGDDRTAEMAEGIRDEERRMMERLESDFDGAEAASHGELTEEEMDSHIRRHLNEAHALEAQAMQLLEKGKEIVGDSHLKLICEQNLREVRRHSAQLENRLGRLDSGPSPLKDSAMELAALNWAYFFQAQSDTPAKLAGFLYAHTHLKIAGYELLRRSATRGKDPSTEDLSMTLLASERSLGDRLLSGFDSAVNTTLDT